MSNPIVSAVAPVLPPHRVEQGEITAALRSLFAAQHFNVDRLAELHQSVQVRARNLALPLASYAELKSFRERNEAWTRAAVDIGAEAMTTALSRAQLEPRDVDHVFFVTVTGLATPSIDARLVNRLGLRPDVKRTPIFGLGCVAGAAGLARASDYLRAFPDQVAVLLSVELCSLTLQRDDLSIANIISSGLFGDGAAAVVLEGGARKRTAPKPATSSPSLPRIVATRSVFYPETERIMGWDFVDGGFKIVLSAKVPTLVEERVGADVDGFLASLGLARGDVRHWIAHTGGPKVLRAFEKALSLPADALKASWTSLEEVGNLSSASVLFVLGDHLERGREGDLGLLIAMGPGFCSELVLLRW